MENITGKKLLTELEERLRSLGDTNGVSFYVQDAEHRASSMPDERMIKNEATWGNPVNAIVADIRIEIEDAIAAAESEGARPAEKGAQRLLAMVETNSSSTGKQGADYTFYEGTLPLPDKDVTRIRQSIAALGAQDLVV